jgi:hypothetical protein
MAKLSYKFVNPSLTSKDKETLKVAGIKSGSRTKLPSGKIVLGLNRIGATIVSIGETVKGLKSIEEVRAISLRNEEVEERRADRDRQLDEKESSQERGAAKLSDKDKKKVPGEAKRKHGGKLKKAGGFLQQLLTPIWNLIEPFIKFAAITALLKWFQDEKNVEKVKKVVEFVKVIFEFLYEWGTFGITTLMEGFANLFGGMSKIQKGELGGVWDTIMGFGQLLVGFLALKGLAMFLNPFSLMGGILDMLSLLSSDTPELPDKPDKPDKAKNLKKKTWLQKFRQRIRILYKRLKNRWLKKILKVFNIVGVFLVDLAAKIAKWGVNFFKNTVKPLIDKAVEKAIEVFKKALPPNVLKRLGDGLDAVKKGGADILKRADDLTKPLREGASKVIDTTKDIIADPRQALSEVKQTIKKQVGGKASDLAKWFASTKFGKQVIAGAGVVKGAWDVTSDFAINQYKNFKSGLDDFIKGVTELPQTISNQWNKLAEGAQELAKRGKDFVVDKFLAPLKAGADDLIKNTPIGKFFVDQFAGKAGKEGGEGLFKKFVKMAKPGVLGVKNALDAAPFKIGPLDIIVDALIAAMELKAGQDPRRVALKLTGSILGLIAGTAILGAIGAGTGGIGAAILAGVVTGATQWGGEWLADKLADMIGIPKKDVSFLDAFSIDQKEIDEASKEDNKETPQASAGGLIRGVRLATGGPLTTPDTKIDPTNTGSYNPLAYEAAQKARSEARAEGLSEEEVEKKVAEATKASLKAQEEGEPQPGHKPPVPDAPTITSGPAEGFVGAAQVILQVMQNLFPGLNKKEAEEEAKDADGDTASSGDNSSHSSGGGYTGDPGSLAVSGSVIDKGVSISKAIMKEGGATKQAAAAIAGNMAHESAGFVPGIREGGPFGKSSKPWPKGTVGKGYGWAQWTNSRPGDRYDKFIESYGGDYNKMPSNTDNYKFLMSELLTGNGGFIRRGAGTSGSWSEFKAKTDVVNATVDFRKSWERAGVAHDESRIKYAKQFLPKLSAGGAVNNIGAISQSVAASHEKEDEDLVVVPVPKMIPMPINRTQGVSVNVAVSGKSDSVTRFENY